jgi:ribosome-binding factor A
MSQRIARVNQLLQREVSEQMRRYYRAESAAITISDVHCSVDLRHARIYYSVLGDEAAIAETGKFFQRIGKDLRQRVSKQITLKYFPRFDYVYDPSMERGAQVLELLDALEDESTDETEHAAEP